MGGTAVTKLAKQKRHGTPSLTHTARAHNVFGAQGPLFSPSMLYGSGSYLELGRRVGSRNGLDGAGNGFRAGSRMPNHGLWG